LIGRFFFFLFHWLRILYYIFFCFVVCLFFCLVFLTKKEFLSSRDIVSVVTEFFLSIHVSGIVDFCWLKPMLKTNFVFWFSLSNVFFFPSFLDILFLTPNFLLFFFFELRKHSSSSWETISQNNDSQIFSNYTYVISSRGNLEKMGRWMEYKSKKREEKKAKQILIFFSRDKQKIGNKICFFNIGVY